MGLFLCDHSDQIDNQLQLTTTLHAKIEHKQNQVHGKWTQFCPLLSMSASVWKDQLAQISLEYFGFVSKSLNSAVHMASRGS